MISALILAAALSGQVNAYDGPPRSWQYGSLNGQATWVWGWKDANGWIRFHQPENPQLYPQYRPAAAPKPSGVTLGAGMVLQGDGTINSGLKMQETRPTGVVDTNDPDLGSKLAVGEDCPNDEPNDPDLPKPDQAADLNTYLIIGAAGLVIVLVLKK